MSYFNSAQGRKRYRDAEGRFLPRGAAKMRKTCQTSSSERSQEAIDHVRGNHVQHTPSDTVEQEDQTSDATITDPDLSMDGADAPAQVHSSASASISTRRISDSHARQDQTAGCQIIEPTQAGVALASANTEATQAARYYSNDETRNALVNEYFAQNPITDVEGTLQAYYQKYSKGLQPFDHGDQTDDQLLMCLCLRPDDGGHYLECDNGFRCMKQFFHPACIGISLNAVPEEGEEWYCPDCLRDGRGGAAAFIKRLAQRMRKPRNVIRQATTAAVIDKVNDLSINTSVVKSIQSSDPALTFLKPWTADLDKKFTANPDNVRDLNIETLQSAKEALRARAAQPLGKPVPKQPTVINGTVVRQPNKNTWTKQEDDVLKVCMREAMQLDLNGNPLWDWVIVKLQERGINRKLGAARNRWMRGLREETQLDERRKKNAKRLTTAVQISKGLRDPNSPRSKTRRYKVSRKYNDPAGTPLPPSPLRTETLVAPSSPAPPSSPARRGAPTAIMSSPVRASHFTTVGDVKMHGYDDDTALTDAEGLKRRITRQRMHSG